MVFVAASHPGRIRRSRRIRQSCTMPDATLAHLIMPTNHIAHFNKLSFIPYSSTSAIIDFQLNHHLMNKNN
ncbi:hypothetical protein, partial [Escherichia coli]|uniref:hypothetical protein n=1 Tax=Escherichia coli TaxID=562 RepID=UPI0025509B95